MTTDKRDLCYITAYYKALYIYYTILISLYTLYYNLGAVSALVCITPAAGYVDMNGAFFIGTRIVYITILYIIYLYYT